MKRRYPGAQCKGKFDSDDADVSPGVCWVPGDGNDIGPGLVLWFGLDPAGEEVRSIWLDVDSWQTIKRLRRR